MTTEGVGRFSWVEMGDDTRKKVLDWLVATCLLFGTTRKTAYLVASCFADSLDRDVEDEKG